MNRIVKMVLTLTVLGLISGIALSMVSNYTDPLIKQNQQEALREAVFYVIQSTEEYEERTVDDKVIYESYGSSGDLEGYAFTASGGGYQGTIELMVGVGSELNEVKGIEILASEETPGLGGKIRGEDFKNQFRGLEAGNGVGLVKSESPDEGEIQAITGATISSKAVVDIVNKELSQVRDLLSRSE
ncbi:MAG: RnfABCDGE type electron transport complex subunit G [Candidatus Acetothermia bacterium]